MTRRTALTLVNAIIWAAVIIGAAVVLQAAAYFIGLLPILGGGAAAWLVIVGRGNRRLEAR